MGDSPSVKEKRKLQERCSSRGPTRGDSRYAWLPIRFEGEAPVIEWRDVWDLSVFETKCRAWAIGGLRSRRLRSLDRYVTAE